MNTIIEVRDLTFSYDDGSSGKPVIKGISFSVEKGGFIGIIGHTGSGKSTLLQLLIGLLKPRSGEILFYGEDIFSKGYDLKKLRSRVGLVFQYPEYQLFEENVFKDVCYGPANLGLTRKECELRAYEALKSVGLSDDCFYASPFELSGGQKRRAAIAGILAMKPEVLVLDEPTAGLDPAGRREIMNLIFKLRKERDITVILVTHSMEDMASCAEKILVLDNGQIGYFDTPAKVFSHTEELESIGLSAPAVTYIMMELRKRGMDVPTDVIRPEDARDEIIAAFARRKA